MDRARPFSCPTDSHDAHHPWQPVDLGTFLDRVGRLVGAARFLERPEGQQLVERAVAASLGPLAARIEATAAATESHLLSAMRSLPHLRDNPPPRRSRRPPR